MVMSSLSLITLSVLRSFGVGSALSMSFCEQTKLKGLSSNDLSIGLSVCVLLLVVPGGLFKADCVLGKKYLKY